LLPFYWMIVTSFKTDGQIQQALSLFWPAPWTMHQINSLLFETDFLHWFLNTIQVAVVSVFVGVLASAAGAYALARLRWRGSSFFATMLLLTYMMPGVAMLIPLYQIMSMLHLVNTLQALMLAYPSFTLPFACWLLMSYYRSIPEELEDAAMIDGATRAQTFFKLILPLSKPALVCSDAVRHHRRLERVLPGLHPAAEQQGAHPAGGHGPDDLRRHLPAGPTDGRIVDDGHSRRRDLWPRPALHGGRPDGGEREGVAHPKVKE